VNFVKQQLVAAMLMFYVASWWSFPSKDLTEQHLPSFCKIVSFVRTSFSIEDSATSASLQKSVKLIRCLQLTLSWETYYLHYFIIIFGCWLACTYQQKNYWYTNKKRPIRHERFQTTVLSSDVNSSFTIIFSWVRLRAGTGWKMVYRSGPAGWKMLPVRSGRKRTGWNHMPNRWNSGKNRRKSNDFFRNQFFYGKMTPNMK
jgi:hypothetical protein